MPKMMQKKKKQNVIESCEARKVHLISLWTIMCKLVLKNKPTLIATK